MRLFIWGFDGSVLSRMSKRSGGFKSGDIRPYVNAAFRSNYGLTTPNANIRPWRILRKCADIAERQSTTQRYKITDRTAIANLLSTKNPLHKAVLHRSLAVFEPGDTC